MFTTSLLACASLAAIFLTRLWIKRIRVAKSVGNLPGFITLFRHMSLADYLLPRIPLITNGIIREIETGYADFAAAGHDTYAHTTVWPNLRVTLNIAGPDTIKEITTHRSRFPKPVEIYRLLSIFGKNIVVSEGDEWRRYRKISAPAFSERNNQLVWNETIRIVLDMIDNVWKRAEWVTYDDVLEITLPIALFAIAGASFGRRMSFTDEDEVPSGFTMSFKHALRIVADNVVIKVAVPKRALCLTQRFRNVDRAFDELERHMMLMIHSEKQADKREERFDLFSSLLDATNHDKIGEKRLEDSELIGNVFMFLLAGHETTGHTLAFCFAFLALYPEKQEKLHQHIKSVMSDLGRLPMYEDMSRFAYAMAVFYETMRIRPPAVVIPKRSEEDTTLNVKDALGATKTIHIPKGTHINIHTPGLHNDPRYWENPSEFIPERFLGDYPKDAFLPFSGGPRACIGRRFAETEAVAVLTTLVSQYCVSVKQDPKYTGETWEQCHIRLLRCRNGITTTPVNVPLTFKRRA